MLFRGILAIPVAIVWLLLSFGLAVAVIFIGWPAALTAGRLPAAVHQALAAVLRYSIRYNGYVYLLTGAYPAGLFGDASGHWAGGAGASGEDASSRLALSPGARRLVGLMLVLGLLTAAGGGWAGVTISAAIQRDREISQLRLDVARFNPIVARHNAAVTRDKLAIGQARHASQAVNDAYAALALALNSPSADSSNCFTVSCFDATAEPGAKAFAAFGRTLHSTAIPPAAAALAQRLAADTVAIERFWVAMTKDTSLDGVGSDAKAAEKTGGQFDSDVQALTTSLDDDLTPLVNQSFALDSAAKALNRQGAALRQRASALNVLISVLTAAPGS